MENILARTSVNTRLRLRWPSGCAVLIFEDPSLTETHRPSRIAAAIADPSSVTRTCVTAQLVAGAKREAVLKSLLSDYLDGCCATWTVSRKPEVVRTFDRSPFGGSRNTRSQRPRERSNFIRHFGWRLGRPGHGDSRSYQAPLSGTNAQLGHQRPPTLSGTVGTSD
jgi:hypothetical protein